MKLVRLELQNFRQHLSTAIDFTDGVTGVIGPNGAGKTTILEAIAWALYGSPALRGNIDSVRSKAAPGGAKATVALGFELGGAQYRVARAVDASKSGHAVLEVDGRPLRTGTKEVNAAIAHLLGMDYQAFFTSFFTAQKELEFMASLDGRARAAAIGRMLGYDRLSKARDQANSDRLGLAREIEGLEKGLPDPEELKQRKKDAQSALAQAKKLLDEAEAARKAAQESVDRLKPLKETSDQKSKRREELSRRLEIDRADVARMETRVGELKAEIDGLKAKRGEFDGLRTKLSGFKEQAEELKRLSELSQFEGERQRLGGRIAALETDVKNLTGREKALAGAKDAQTRRQAALDTAETLLAETDKKIQGCREARIARQHSLEAQIGQLEAQARQVAAKRIQIAEAGTDGKCPTCERPLASELPTVLANFDSQTKEMADRVASLTDEKAKLEQDDGQLAGLTKSRESVASQIEQIRKEKTDADAKLAESERVGKDLGQKSAELGGLQAELGKLPAGFDTQRFRELQQLKESLQPDRDRLHALNGELERQAKVETEFTDLGTQFESKRQEIAQSEKTLSEIGFSEQDHEKLSREFEAASVQLNSALVNVEKQRGEVNTATAILAQSEREEEAYKAKVEGLTAKRSERLHLQTLSEAFDKLRAELNDRIRPELESIASELLSEMTDGRYNTLEISEGYSAIIRDDGELKPVISGGEDDIVNLALRLAVSQMIADRAGQSFSLLVLDEVFGSLDDVRRDNVVALLQNLKNRFEQIIVITHVEAIHDAVDNCLWVGFDEKTKTSRLIDRSIEIDAIPAGVLT
jgi:exonuclease SbcC